MRSTTHVREVSGELAARGHRVLIVAPSSSATLVRESRKLVRSGGPELLARADGAPLVVAVGEAALPHAGRGSARRCRSTSRARSATCSSAPRSTSATCTSRSRRASSAAALRSSRALNVGSFHVPQERVVATQVARKVVQLVLGRLDARTASYATTQALMERHFPARLRAARPRRHPRSSATPGRRTQPIRIAFTEDEERPALRLLLRALRQIEAEQPWELVVRTTQGPSSTPLRADLRERVHYVDAADTTFEELLAGADIFVGASAGADPQPALLARAAAAGVVPVASRLPAYEEVLAAGERGLLFNTRDTAVLAAQLTRLIDDEDLRERLRSASAPRPWTSRRRPGRGPLRRGSPRRRKQDHTQPEMRRRLASRATIDVDLHMHTDHSHDCATPVEVLLATARERGLGAIAVTDHNEVSGAFEAQAKSAEYGVKVIVAEEVKTASQGEVIGLFLKEKIERGMTLAGDRRRDQAPGRARLRAASVRPHARRAGLRASARRSSSRSTRSRSSTRASRSAPSTRRRRASPPSTGSRPGPDRMRTSPRAWARHGCGCATSTGPRSSWSRSATPRSSRRPPTTSTSRR